MRADSFRPSALPKLARASLERMRAAESLEEVPEVPGKLQLGPLAEVAVDILFQRLHIHHIHHRTLLLVVLPVQRTAD
jgi:hypothetical protein